MVFGLLVVYYVLDVVACFEFGLVVFWALCFAAFCALIYCYLFYGFCGVFNWFFGVCMVCVWVYCVDRGLLYVCLLCVLLWID